MPVVREELVALNRQIASHAQARDLAAARSVLQTLESKGWANGHTYAAAVHALCRCGDWRSAEEALARAEKAGLFNRGAGAASGLITRTFPFVQLLLSIDSFGTFSLAEYIHTYIHTYIQTCTYKYI